MKISRTVLQKAVDGKIINSKQASALFEFIKNQPEKESSFNLTNVLYYFGGFLAIGAMTLFMNLGWEKFGGWGIFFLSLLYAGIGLWLSETFQKKSLVIPAGICATFVICLTPLAIYALQLGMGWWPDSTTYQSYHALIKWNWIYMELGTLIVGITLAWRYRYAFMIMPIAITLWYMSMDIVPMITGSNADFAFRATVSLYFGLLMILLAFWVDIRSRHSADYAFWLYLFGVITFWCGLTAQESDNEISKFLYLCVNILMMGMGVILMRKVFDVFGAIGCCLYIGHLTWQVFQNSIFFPIVLTLIGLLIIYLGTLWQKHAALITKKTQSILPKPIQELLQARQNN
jgi:hypothetical protein